VKEMPRWIGLTLLVVALSACQDTQSTTEPQDILDQLGTREDAYQTMVASLTGPAAIRGETVTYAADMHDLIDKLRHSSQRSTGIHSMMSGYTLEDVNLAMDQMRSSVDSYVVRLKHLEIVGDLKEAANEHQAAMNEMFEEMDGMLAGRS
jgi:hypothetical protein